MVCAASQFVGQDPCDVDWPASAAQRRTHGRLSRSNRSSAAFALSSPRTARAARAIAGSGCSPAIDSSVATRPESGRWSVAVMAAF
jgi:hypothetical protein